MESTGKNCYILSIETSQKVSSVALHNSSALLASSTLFNEKAASGLLTPLIEQLLKNCDLKPTDLEAVAVAKGPGSYTGLRIATSTAKGLCLAIEKPLIAINTLEAMVLQVADFYEKSFLFCPMLDARRMEVYCALYDSNLNCLQDTEAKIIDENSFIDLLSNNSIVFFGDGATKCKSIFGENKNAHFINKNIWPSANTIGKLAFEKYIKNDFENLVTFEPFYLKEFVGNVSIK